MNVVERFENKFIPEPNTGCFIWTGSLDWSGYGRLGINGRNWKANRVAWLIAHGDPGEKHVLHRCDNRMCVNTDHLFLGTNRDNCLDKAVKGRCWQAKLTPDAVRTIREMAATGASKSWLARQYRVDECTIRYAVDRRSWSHVS